MNKEIVLSVHGLVDFLLRRGDIDNRIYNSNAMSEGTRIHLRYQQIQSGEYLKEQYLETKLDIDDFTFVLSGRADGIIVNEDKVIIDEIKSTVSDLDKFYEEQKEWHLGQAKVYAYMYLKMNNLKKCGVRLTYISQLDFSDKLILNFTYSFEELEEFIIDLCKKYLVFYTSLYKHKLLKKHTAEELSFPFENYRPGQRDLAKYVYGAILNNESVFIEAPTGIGKTMSTLFPSVKAFSSLDIDKIFYLSAKNVAKNVAFDACKLLIKKGLVIRAIKLSSKEKLCRCDSRKCNPDECPFTKGYYDKLMSVISETIKKYDTIDENIVNQIADEQLMCPFELQLDLSLYCDVIICDYNYLFDPLVYLKRFFEQEITPYVALIDEAHNLVDRSRDMYSATIDNNMLKNLRHEFKRFKALSFKKSLRKLINYIDEQKKNIDEEYIRVEENFDSKFYSLVENAFKNFQDIMKNFPEYTTNLFLESFRMLNRFLKISDYIDESFALYYQIIDDEVVVNIRCVDSSKLVKHTLSKLQASIFFSATLTPIDYYISCLGGDEYTPKVILDSPFDKNNLLTIVRDDISTRLKDRNLSYDEIAKTIESIVSQKKGNYLVFFSSYQYLKDVYACLEQNENIKYIVQEREMEEEDRNRFLDNFALDPKITTVGMAVLGGAFSEGIDLTSERLIGAIIIGVGMPTISYERNIVKDYFQENGKDGFDFAYVFPGMNKVMQAAGRVIRGEFDIGLVVFIDDRFSYWKYKALLKEQYKYPYHVKDTKKIKEIVSSFWEKHEN